MPLRSFIALLLALLLTLTSQSMAVARGASDATGQMVICVGGGMVTVHTDADGVPTSAPHICPDCALHLVFLPESTDVAVPYLFYTIDLSHCRLALFNPCSKGLLPQTRAPPLFV